MRHTQGREQPVFAELAGPFLESILLQQNTQAKLATRDRRSILWLLRQFAATILALRELATFTRHNKNSALISLPFQLPEDRQVSGKFRRCI